MRPPTAPQVIDILSLSFRFARFARTIGPMKATRLVIGMSTLAVIAAGFVGMLAVQKIRGVRNQSPLRIVFNGSASGLRKGGTVIFDGVPAGEIKSIKLENPRR